MPLRDLRPSILFGIGLCLLTGALILFEITTKVGWCASDEHLPKCVRDWLSPLANILAVVVASIAAYFALGSFRAARSQADHALRQADYASLPSLTDRMGKLKLIRDLFSTMNGLVATSIYVWIEIEDSANTTKSDVSVKFGSGYFDKLGELIVDLEKCGQEIYSAYCTSGFETVERLAIAEAVSAASYVSKSASDLIEVYDTKQEHEGYIWIRRTHYDFVSRFISVLSGNHELLHNTESTINFMLDKMRTRKDRIIDEHLE